jgi:hypothetical protein
MAGQGKELQPKCGLAPESKRASLDVDATAAFVDPIAKNCLPLARGSHVIGKGIPRES